MRPVTHPPLETADAATLVAAWEGAIHAVSGIGRSLSAAEWDLPTECPGWSVGDLVRHVAAIECFLAGRPLPAHEPDWAALPHATGAVGRFTEVGVDARRGDAPSTTCDELDAVTDERLAQLMGLEPLALETQVPGLFGKPVPLDTLLRVRIFDVWTHEQDLRRAIGRPGGLGSAGAQVSAAQMLAALPRVLAKVLGAAPGEALAVVVGQEVTFVRAATVDTDGRGVLLPPDHDGDVTVSLTADWETYARLSAGRLDVTSPDVQDLVTITGDAPWRDGLLAALSVTP